MKVYIKKGTTNYKEKRLIKALEESLEKKITENPDFLKDFKPATSYEELVNMHNHYCIDEVEIISETKNNATPQNPTPDASQELNEHDDTELNGGKGDDSGFKFEGQDNPNHDPMNRANPKIRDYVLKDSMAPEGEEKSQQIGNMDNISEPKSHEEAFKLPGEETEDGGGGKGEGKSAGPKRERQEPVNPSFDEMSNSRKNKQTKRFAKNIVEAVAMLLEFGYVYWTTKDINDTKLAEYELNNEMELDLLLSLDEEQEMTVKQFFQYQCKKAEEDAKISKEDKEELSEALADVLLEKGIAPTPTQNLIMVGLKVLGGQVIKATVSNAQTNAILNSLRERKAQEKKQSKAGEALLNHIHNSDPDNTNQNPDNNSQDNTPDNNPDNPDNLPASNPDNAD